MPAPTKPAAAESPNQELWRKIGEALTRDVLEFNDGHGRMFDISHMGSGIIQLSPKQAPIDTLKLECSNGTIRLSHYDFEARHVPNRDIQDAGWQSGVQRSANGRPQATGPPMDADEFSQAVPEPFLFPEP